MSRTLNEVRLIGRLGKDPTMTYSPNGVAVTKFSIATNRYSKDADGTTREETDWHQVVTFDRVAETCNQYLAKGSQVYIGGRLQTQSWDKDGQRHYRTEVIAGEVIMLDPKRQAAEDDEEPAF